MTLRPLLLVVLGVLAVVVLGRSCGVPAAPPWAGVPAPPPPPFSADPAAGPPSPDDWAVLADLSGEWAFRIGDDARWATGPTDAGWDRMPVPGAWEDAGYHGYDGTAWYRTAFVLDAQAAAGVLTAPPYLLLGRIDDVDEVWLNGVRVGRGGHRPPEYRTAAFSFRRYRLPPGLLRADGPNVLAVRVYDAGLEGGILEGPVALAVPTARNPDGVPFAADLEGDWRFSPGDGAWASPGLDDAGWDTLRVPGVWETQGYRDLGGVAWYRKRVDLSAETAARDLVLVLGAVDDLDETFVNGARVGATGDVDGGEIRGDEWAAERAYPVPARLLRPGENVVAVRVYDGPVDGGIHRGPVALLTAEAYAERRRRTRGDTR